MKPFIEPGFFLSKCFFCLAISFFPGTLRAQDALSYPGSVHKVQTFPLPLFSPARQFRDVKSISLSPQIAITFDDLPAHGSLPQGVTRAEIASKILDALRQAGTPPAYGFVNGLPLQRQPLDSVVLKAWRTADQPLANHTWSHMDLNKHSMEDFEADTIQNEPLLSTYMKDGDWHWFRFPFLSEGDSLPKRSAVRAFLAQRGYKIAAVTMSFEDYQWTEPYARCKAKNDARAITAMEDTYLAAADESISYYRALSHTLLGRDIPYVLLLHLGAFDAEMLPRLLKLYRSRGFVFVTLAEAERDEFYRGSIDPRLPADSDTLEEAMAKSGLPLPARASPGPLLDALCR